jgi:hypothetical protein
MKKLILSFANVLILVVWISSVFAQDKCIFQEEGFTRLFNGNDLSGWIIPEGDNGHWSVIDGVIDYDARSEAEVDKNLWSVKEYKDFKLHVEWRFKGYGDHLFSLRTVLPNGDYLRDENGDVINYPGPNSDSGILLKGEGQVNLWCWSVGSGELWSVRNNKDLPAEVRAGAVPSSNQDNPVGFWNAFDITVEGERITIKNNGIVVINNALYPGLNVKGPIGFQHHGGVNKETGKMKGGSSLVQFRNIWIKEL